MPLISRTARWIWSLQPALAALTALTLLSSSAFAAGITGFSPQGEVAQIRQARAGFFEPMVKFGDPKAAAPFDVDCPVAGTSRWADGKNWVYDFEHDLPPGTRCSFTLKPGVKAVSGAALGGKVVFRFSTGGPAVVRHMPSGEEIEEEQAFILFQNGAANQDTVRDHLYCEAEGVHERIPVKFVADATRKQLLQEFAKKSIPPPSPSCNASSACPTTPRSG